MPVTGLTEIPRPSRVPARRLDDRPRQMTAAPGDQGQAAGRTRRLPAGHATALAPGRPVRRDLVARIQRQLADGCYPEEQRMEQALARLIQEQARA